MYNDYFGLKDSPFSIAPNPQFLFMSERHREALAHLLYGIKTDGGFILLTGEVGTGKTTVCRCLLDQIPPEVDIAFVLNPKLTAIELLATICDDLRIDYPDHASIKVLVDRINEYLLDSHRASRRTVLIIDEAQNLSNDVLEQLRLLTNLETNQRKLLQIILLGQPELLEILDQKELRQLAQRVTARFHLEALTESEASIYIGHRLEIAGARKNLFQSKAVKRVFQLSGGIPRVINLICDRALLGAYAEESDSVDMKTVNRAAAEVLGKDTDTQSSTGSFLKPVSIATGLVVAIGVGAAILTMRPPEVSSLANMPLLKEFVQPQPETYSLDTHETPESKIVSVGNVEQKPAITAVVTPTKPPSTNKLLDLEGDSNSDVVVRQMLEKWHVPSGPNRISACDQASRFGLECLTMLGSLREIKHMDRPVLVKLTVASIDHYFTVTGFDGDIVLLSSSEGNFRLMPRDMTQSWDGNIAILWRPPSAPENLVKGAVGPAVDLLRSRLAQANGDSDPEVGIPFDDSLESRLVQFQLSVGLRPDGIAGTQTWIHLENAISNDVPRLTKSVSEADMGEG